MPRPFTYHRPARIDEALRLLAEPGAAALAGGTDLVTMRARGAVEPDSIVDIKTLPELRGIEVASDGAIRIGATTTMREVSRYPARALAAIGDGAGIVGAEQTRARASLGGNLCRASPAGDTLCGLLVLGATAELRRVGGHREVAVSDFFVGPGRAVREPDELLIAISLPAGIGGGAYERFTYRRSMDLAVVGVAAHVVIEGGDCVAAAVAIGAAAPTPMLVAGAADALLGTPCDQAAIAASAEAVVAAARPIDDVRGTRAHRLRVIGPLARRVIESAVGRAGAV